MGWFSNPKEYYDKVRMDYGRCCAACEGLCVNNNQLDKDDNTNVISHFFSTEFKYKCGPKSGWLGREYRYLSEQRECFREGRELWYKRDFEELYRRLKQERRYFILTAICDILGMDRDNRIYKEVKALIDLVRSDETTQKEAIAYDSFGPEIAERLRQDPERVNICNYLLNNYLVQIYIHIGLNNTTEAINVYRNMVEYLFIRYRNMDNYSELINSSNFENPKVMIK